MKPNTSFSISLAAILLLAQGINPSWGLPPTPRLAIF